MSGSTKFRKQAIPAQAGIGLRGDHYEHVANNRPGIGWFEVHTENYFGAGGVPHYFLTKIRADYALSFHGVGLSIGSVDPLDTRHLKRTRQLIEQYEPGLVSEHLSWSSFGGEFSNDLLPLPLTEECLHHFSDRVLQVQDTLGYRILIENPSTYLALNIEQIPEAEFLNALAEKTGCGLLLDINNVFVSATNHGFCADSYLDTINVQHVEEIHLAGHTKKVFADGSILIDTHNARVCTDVWELFEAFIKRAGNRPTLIEWDTDLPAFDVLMEEAAMATTRLEKNNAVAA